MKSSIWKTIKRNKYIQSILLKYYAEREAREAFRNGTRPIILIYQRGKVGSRTVFESLKSAGIPNPVLHVHFLSDDIKKHREDHRKAGVFPLPYHLESSLAIRKYLKHYKGPPLKIISLVREPISFILSVLFQPPYFEKEIKDHETGGIHADKLIEYVIEQLSGNEIFRYMEEWFDREIRNVFGIDVMSEAFPVESGYKVYKNDNAEVLILRLEDLSENGPSVISDFIGMEGELTLDQRHERMKSADAGLYSKVTSRLKLDRTICRRVYDRDFVRHFYSQEHIDSFIEKWS